MMKIGWNKLGLSKTFKYTTPKNSFLILFYYSFRGRSFSQAGNELPASSQLGTSSKCFSHIPRSKLGTSLFSNWLKIRPQETFFGEFRDWKFKPENLTSFFITLNFSNFPFRNFVIIISDMKKRSLKM
jgi:hypothetical protein